MIQFKNTCLVAFLFSLCIRLARGELLLFTFDSLLLVLIGTLTKINRKKKSFQIDTLLHRELWIRQHRNTKRKYKHRIPDAHSLMRLNVPLAGYYFYRNVEGTKMCFSCVLNSVRALFLTWMKRKTSLYPEANGRHANDRHLFFSFRAGICHNV